jgi:hypothetical protein
MAAWTAGILLALGIIWFVAAVVVSVRQTRDAAEDVWMWNTSCPDNYPTNLRKCVERLGSPGRAIGKLHLYLHLPERVAPYHDAALRMLGHCGSEAVPVLVPFLRSKEVVERQVAAEQLGALKDRRAVEALAAALQDADERVRATVADALGEIGDARAEPALGAAAKDSDWRVRREARRALQKMRGQPVESNAEGIP